MSLQRVLSENALPGAAALIAAAFAYMLTGGEEEYPPAHPDGREKGLDDEEGSEPPLESEPVLDRIESQLRLFGDRLDDLEKTKPEWATELLALSRSLAADVSLIKASMSLSPTSPIRLDAPALQPLSPPVVSTPTLEESAAALCDSIWAFVVGLPSEVQVSATSVLQATGDGASDTTEQLSEADIEASKRMQAGCDVLLMFVRNLLKFPTIARYRRLMTSNPSFATSLALCPSHDRVLLALGFARKEGMWEQEAPQNAELRGQLMRTGQGLLEAAKQGRSALIEAMRPLLCSPAEPALEKEGDDTVETQREHDDVLAGIAGAGAGGVAGGVAGGIEVKEASAAPR